MDTNKKGRDMFDDLLRGLDEEAINSMIEFLLSYKRANFPGNSVECTEVRENVGMSMEQRVTAVLNEIGVPKHIKGWKYLKMALVEVAKDETLMEGITKCLYPNIAKAYDSTGSRVERSIRHAIETAWDQRSSKEAKKKFFGNTISKKGKPTNSEFIAALAEYIRNAQNK